MGERLADGLYDELMTSELVELVRNFDRVEKSKVSDETLDEYLLRSVASELVAKFKLLKGAQEKLRFANELLEAIGSTIRLIDDEQAEVLLSLVFDETTGTAHLNERPSGGLSQITLITNSGPGLNAGNELRKELPSADRVLILMAFVKKAGINHVEKQLAILRDRKVQVCLITSVYMAGTQAEALDRLVNEFGVEVKVSYDADLVRLHAKAWLMERESGFTTAIIGSSNMSNSAMANGLEWNVRLTSVSSPEVIDEFKVAFDTYWNSDSFKTYNPSTDRQILDDALRIAGKIQKQDGVAYFVPNLDVQPRLHQSKMLEDLEFERNTLGHHQNLVVAATGTGKTVLAALDYLALEKHLGKRPRLLFIAHRQEILNQAISTYRAVLKDPGFGEQYVGGKVPGHWKHVFASVQSISAKDVQSFAADAFDIVVIDEFHHATASTYRQIINYLEPKELLGLTATPERSEGLRVQDEFFNGRIASELRLWDAMEQGLLSPFEYFGVGESKEVVDYAKIEWSSGKYQTKSLSKYLTHNELRDRLVIKEIHHHVDDPGTMKALVFCVDQSHAEYVASMLSQKAGLKAVSVTSKTKPQERENAVQDLRDGKIQAITSVDVFNEGVDIPEVDTVLMLRPTESSVVFMQQLGRGLRLAPDKASVTVLDFIGLHRADFRIDKKYAALVGKARTELKEQIKSGFQDLPSGVNLSLDSVAQDFILKNLEEQLGLGIKKLVAEVQSLGTSNFQDFLAKTGVSLDDVISRTSWYDLCFQAGLAGFSDLGAEARGLLGKAKRLTHIDDLGRIDAYSKILTNSYKDWDALPDYEKRHIAMLFWNLFPDARLGSGLEAESYEEAFAYLREFPEVLEEFQQVLIATKSNVRKQTLPIQFKTFSAPLFTHASYTRDELLGALGYGNLELNPTNASGGKTRKSKGQPTGALYLKDINLDLFFINILKEESKFSVSTRYHDYALTPEIFCWDSQNTATLSTGDGARYASQPETRQDVLLALREKSNGGSFKLIGLADFVSATGDRPIKIRWKLRRPLDAETYSVARAIKTA